MSTASKSNRTTHTPGTWVSYEDAITGYEVILDESGPCRCVIAVVEDQAEGEANAHLIAAAPDLYEACKELLASWEMTRSTVGARLKAKLDRAEAAIAKAEGR